MRVGRLDIAGVALAVEQRRGQPVALQPVAQSAQQRGIAGKPQRERFVLGERDRDQLGQADRLQQAARHPADEGIARHRSAPAARPTGRRWRWYAR